MDQGNPSAMEEGSEGHQESQDTSKVAVEEPAPDPKAPIEMKTDNSDQSNQSQIEDTNMEVFQHRALEQTPASTILRKMTLHVIETTPPVAVENDGVVVVAPAVVKEGVFVVGPADGVEVEFKNEPDDPPESMSDSDSDEANENFAFPEPFVLPKTEFPDKNQSGQCDRVSNGDLNVDQMHEGKKIGDEVQNQLIKLGKEKSQAKIKEKKYSEKERLDRRHLRSTQKLKFLDRQLKELNTSEAYIQAKKNPNLKENVTKWAFIHYFKGLSPDFQKLTPLRKKTYLFTFEQCVHEQIEQELAENE